MKKTRAAACAAITESAPLGASSRYPDSGMSTPDTCPGRLPASSPLPFASFPLYFYSA
jgi:hypothetical protein